jgi:hypothetical protein
MWGVNVDRYFEVLEALASGYVRLGLEVSDEAIAQIAARVEATAILEEVKCVLKDFDHQICMGLTMAEKNHLTFSNIGSNGLEAIAEVFRKRGE